MLASLYYEPLWVFYRSEDVSQLNELRGKRIAVGAEGERNASTRGAAARHQWDETGQFDLSPLAGDAALAALQAGDIDAVLLVGGVQTPIIVKALHDPALKLMSFAHADAYARRFPHITKLTLPAGTVDFALDIPEQDVMMIGTKAMLAARPGLHPALVNLLLDAASDIHSKQGYFEDAGEFPGVAPVDLAGFRRRASATNAFGPSFIHRIASVLGGDLRRAIGAADAAADRRRDSGRQFLSRNSCAGAFAHASSGGTANSRCSSARWRRARVHFPSRSGCTISIASSAPVEDIQTPTSFASEAYTLREHIGLVRRAVLAKAGAPRRVDVARRVPPADAAEKSAEATGGIE